MPSKETIVSIIKDMAKHLKDDTGFAKFTVNGRTFQKMPETTNKNGDITGPAKLGYIYNPIIEGKTAKKGKYIWTANYLKAYHKILTDELTISTILLKCMEKVNPKDSGNGRSNKISDHSYDDL